jgi:tetratricopeptide (TPR) repeat protein
MDVPTSDVLHDRLQNYKTAIAALTDPPPDAKALLTALLARDALQAALADNTPSTDTFLQIKKLDSQLKERRDWIRQVGALSDWRAMHQPDSAAWWWWLDAEDTPQASRHDWLWNGLSLTFLTLASGLILNMASRFWSGGVASAGTIALLGQGTVTLLAGKGALTDSGRKAWENFLGHYNVPAHYRQGVSCGASGLVLLGVTGVHLALPWFATWYNAWGLRDYQANHLASALSNYQTAISLRPDYATVHYRLGLLYEDLQRQDEAVAAYQFVVARSPAAIDEVVWLQANNNLGRLYILQDQPDVAVELLLQGLDALDQDQIATNPDLAQVQYSLLKNLGWARLEQGRWNEAFTYLDEAIWVLEDELASVEDVPNRGSAHCLLAQVLDAQDQIQEADLVWETCLITANLGNPDEDAWIGVYEQRSPDAIAEEPAP